MPHLLQYVSSGTYFARIKIKGKLICETLETTVWSTAQLKLVDFLKDKREHQSKEDKHRLSFREAVQLFEHRVKQHPAMKEGSKAYRFLCIRKVKATWPELWTQHLDV